MLVKLGEDNIDTRHVMHKDGACQHYFHHKHLMRAEMTENLVTLDLD